MDLQEVDVFIGPDGDVRLAVRGLKGSQCLEVTRELESVLGGEVASRELTAEAYETGAAQEGLWQRHSA